MTIVYFPFLCLIAFYESTFQAKWISQNRTVGLADDETSLGWDFDDPNDAEWREKVKNTIPRIEQDEMYFLKKLEKEMKVGSKVEGATAVDNTGTSHH